MPDSTTKEINIKKNSSFLQQRFGSQSTSYFDFNKKTRSTIWGRTTGYGRGRLGPTNSNHSACWEIEARGNKHGGRSYQPNGKYRVELLFYRFGTVSLRFWATESVKLYYKRFLRRNSSGKVWKCCSSVTKCASSYPTFTFICHIVWNCTQSPANVLYSAVLYSSHWFPLSFEMFSV